MDQEKEGIKKVIQKVLTSPALGVVMPEHIFIQAEITHRLAFVL